MSGELTVTETETNLVKNTEFEKLILGYSQIQNSHRMSNLNMERIADIQLEIKIAYSFLRDMGKPQVEMTIEEFEIAQIEIEKIVKYKIEEWKNKYKKLRRFSWLIVTLPYIKDIKCLIESEEFAQIGRPRYYWQTGWFINYNKDIFVPNLCDLTEEIFQKRFGNQVAVQ